jgi:hypothetical protein
MRRIVTALASVLALALAAPGVALAHHGHGAHHKHHNGHHAKGARVLRFGSVEGSKGTEEGGGTATESIGTVSSYEKEVLTIKLADGSTLSGTVTSETHVICIPSTPPTQPSGSGSDGGDQSWGDWSHSDGSCAEPSSEEGKETEPPAGGSDSGWAGAHGDCMEAGTEVNLEKILVAGAVVKEAELRLTSSGASWESVVVIH